MNMRYNKNVKKVVKRGDIYMIHNTAPTNGCVQSGARPAIIVSNAMANHFSPVVEVVYLTTKPKTSLPTHVAIKSAPKPSTALCEQIDTVSVTQLGNILGRCSAEELADINKALAISIGLYEQII